MADELISLGDEHAKAVKQLATFGEVVVHAGEKLANYVGRVLGTVPEDAVGLIIGDPIRFVRAAIAAQYDVRLTNLFRMRGVTKTVQVSPSLAIPLLRAAYDENREQLQDLWAKLLANAMDPKRNTVRLNFIEAVKRMEPLDAQALQKVRTGEQWAPNNRDAFAQQFKVSSDQMEIAFQNLIAIGCLTVVPGRGPANPDLTAFGRELMRALE
jgi:hypothetical protein